MKRIPKGIIFYNGPSLLDGSPIVVIGTTGSVNIKTGNMIQTWIIRSDVHPSEAVKTGADKSICGACPHRHYSGGSCYVQPFQAPRAVYESFHKGKYVEYNADKHDWILAVRKVRFGAYGDPAVVPFDVWNNIASKSLGVTGYTHHYGANHFDERLTQFCMVSIETPQQYKKLSQKGIKTFRVKTEEAPLLEGEIECLSDSKGLSCQECMICNGSSKSVAINAHGTRNKRFADKFGELIIKQAA